MVPHFFSGSPNPLVLEVSTSGAHPVLFAFGGGPAAEGLGRAKPFRHPKKHDHTQTVTPSLKRAPHTGIQPTVGWEHTAKVERMRNLRRRERQRPMCAPTHDRVSAANSGLNHRRWFAEGAPATDPGGRCGSPQLTGEVNLCQLRLTSQKCGSIFFYILWTACTVTAPL